MPDPLVILPETADVNANAACKFTVKPPGTKVTWSIKPAIGEINSAGVYTSPQELTMPQSVIVLATTDSGETATAAIDLTDAPKRISWLAWYGIVMAVLLALGLLLGWAKIHQPPGALQVIVTPPIVTLDPAKDVNFAFSAMVLGDSRNTVTWSVEGGAAAIDSSGNLTRKLDSSAGIDQTLTVKAASTADPSRTGTAIVRLVAGTHLEVIPPSASAFSAQQIPFRAPNATVTWSVSRSDLASISSDGMLTARFQGPEPGLVQVTAKGAKPQEQAVAAAIVLVNPAFGDTRASSWLLLFVILCGALGSLVYYATSFVGYVGNRTFRSSWFWFYIARPFVGGGLALIFFFMIGSNLLTGTTAGDLTKVALVAALVGLFSDKATRKLSDILDVLLATKDDRKDKMPDQAETKSKDQGAPAQPAAPPTIASSDPKEIPAGQATKVTFKGANFTPDLRVQVNKTDVSPTNRTADSFTLEIPKEQAAGLKAVVAATTAQGTASFDMQVKPAAPPTIASADPKEIPVGEATKVTFKGSNFTLDLKVQVNNVDAPIINLEVDSFTVEIVKEQAAGPQAVVTVTTAQGTASFDLPVK